MFRVEAQRRRFMAVSSNCAGAAQRHVVDGKGRVIYHHRRRSTSAAMFPAAVKLQAVLGGQLRVHHPAWSRDVVATYAPVGLRGPHQQGLGHLDESAWATALLVLVAGVMVPARS
jgi:hypothetical protein